MTALQSPWRTLESCGSDDPVVGKNDDEESGCNRQQNILELINPAINDGPLSQHDAIFQGYFPHTRRANPRV
jgi:hypothetical protein